MLHTKVNNYWKGHWIKHPAQVNLYGLPAELIVKVIKDFVDAQQKDHGEIKNYEHWLRASFGNTFAETFPMEYTIKYHTTEAKNKSLDWIGPRLYQAKLEEVLRGALTPRLAGRPLHRRLPVSVVTAASSPTSSASWKAPKVRPRPRARVDRPQGEGDHLHEWDAWPTTRASSPRCRCRT